MSGQGPFKTYTTYNIRNIEVKEARIIDDALKALGRMGFIKVLHIAVVREEYRRGDGVPVIHKARLEYDYEGNKRWL